MKQEETEASRRAVKALCNFRNSVIDWCISVIVDHVDVAEDLGNDQLNTIIELLQNEKS